LQRDRVITDAAEHYIAIAQAFKREELPIGTQWRQIEAYREKLVNSKEYQVRAKWHLKC
jgi:hypothetical protein